jgi:hypothetical protein
MLAALSQLIQVIFAGEASEIIGNVVLSAIAGVFAGIAVAVIRSWPRRTIDSTAPFVSALFTKGLAAPQLDNVFWARALIGGIIGFLVGGASGSSGMISFLQFFSESSSSVMQNSLFPLHTFLGGGFGGPGGTGFFELVFLIIVIIIAAVVIGLFSGLLLQLLLAGLGGAAKGATKTYIERILEERTTDQEPHPIVAGMKRGALVGLLAGVVQAVFTVWGVVKFYNQS